jgi:hypothetical protein
MLISAPFCLTSKEKILNPMNPLAAPLLGESRSVEIHASQANVPILVVYGKQTPPKSRAEMEALAELPNVEINRLV